MRLMVLNKLTQWVIQQSSGPSANATMQQQLASQMIARPWRRANYRVIEQAVDHTEHYD